MAAPSKRRKYEYEGSDLIEKSLLHQVTKHVKHDRLGDLVTYLGIPPEQYTSITGGSATYDDQINHVSMIEVL